MCKLVLNVNVLLPCVSCVVVAMVVVLPLVTREGVLRRQNTFLWYRDNIGHRISSSKWNCIS